MERPSKYSGFEYLGEDGVYQGQKLLVKKPPPSLSCYAFAASICQPSMIMVTPSTPSIYFQPHCSLLQQPLQLKLKKHPIHSAQIAGRHIDHRRICRRVAVWLIRGQIKNMSLRGRS
jgi:hypothetical protein